MKILFSAIVLLFALFFWVASSGYKYLSFSKNLGTENYIGNNATSSLIGAVVNGISSFGYNKLEPATTTLFVVTHIKTPEKVKAIYMSSWVAGTKSIRNNLIKLIDETELNAIVIDVKDNTGVITWESRAEDLNQFIEELHAKNIYTIARISVFQDPLYVKLHVDEAVKSKSSGGVWKDHKGMTWVDPASKEMWKYIENVSKEAYRRGFDEINLDYIRFPTDGVLTDMIFPLSNWSSTNNKVEIISNFFHYITDSMRNDGIPISADIFGIVLVTKTDIPALGQDAHTVLETFDYVSPMVYPSHFQTGTDGYKNPAAYPKEIVNFSLEKGLFIADEVASSTMQATSTIRAKFRPWYQDFDLGATYTKEMVRAQIEAGYGLGIDSWMLWDPSNKYTPQALMAE